IDGLELSIPGAEAFSPRIGLLHSHIHSDIRSMKPSPTCRWVSGPWSRSALGGALQKLNLQSSLGRGRCAPRPFWSAEVPFRGAGGARTVLQGAFSGARILDLASRPQGYNLLRNSIFRIRECIKTSIYFAIK